MIQVMPGKLLLGSLRLAHDHDASRSNSTSKFDRSALSEEGPERSERTKRDPSLDPKGEDKKKKSRVPSIQSINF